jgi:hypothetical protein
MRTPSVATTVGSGVMPKISACSHGRPSSRPTSGQANSAKTKMTAVHICFGYAAIIHVRPSGYSFLPEFAIGRIVSHALVGGLHHQYDRI